MGKDSEKFLEAEETATKLVETLKQLHIEATSYQTATKQLDNLHKRLLNLIESTDRLTNGSHEVIKILKDIGGPEILKRLTKLESKSTEEFVKQSKGIEKLRLIISITFACSIISIIIGIISLLR